MFMYNVYIYINFIKTFYNNVFLLLMYVNNLGSYKIHKIEKNGKNVPNDIGFKIDLGINVQNEIGNCKYFNKQNIKYLKSWSVAQKRFTNEIVITGKDVIYCSNFI